MTVNRYEKEKKEREKNEFNRFVFLLPDFPQGEIRHEDGPDFRVHTPNKVIGIEHCRVYKPSGNGGFFEQAIDSQVDDVIGTARKYAELEGVPPARVDVVFNYEQTRDKSARKNIARSIVEIVRANMPENGQVSLARGDLNLPDEAGVIANIYISRSSIDVQHNWFPLRVHTCAAGDISLIQIAIDEKRKKFSDYMEKCNECWLLMVANIFTKPSTTIDISRGALTHHFLSPFARIYYLDCVNNELQRLQTKS